MGAEDFSYLLEEVPGAMAFLGTRPAGRPGRRDGPQPLQQDGARRGRNGHRRRPAHVPRPYGDLSGESRPAAAIP